MKKRSLSSMLLCLFAATALAQSSGTPEPAARAKAILDPVAAKFPGLAAAVAVDGKIVWSHAWGYSDLASRTPPTADTLFRVYSTAKSMTAAAIARLGAEGRIDLDAPIQKYVPAYPRKPGPPVTIRLLVHHLGGVRHNGPGESASKKNCATPLDALDIFAADPLLFPAGSKESYSSYGYVLLSAAIEKVTGKKFEDAMRELVFDPAGMTRTSMDVPGRAAADRAVGYDGKPGDWKESPEANVTCKFGAGGLVSTATDLARFGSAFLAGRIVPASRVSALLEPARTTSGESGNYAFGWEIAKRETGAPFVFMSGANTGGRAAIALDPAAKAAAAMTANAVDPPVAINAAQLLELFVKR
jgi:CubicO group peptidase (beta-lactamase class C family)